MLEDIRMFDVFRGVQVGLGNKSVAFSLTFRADDRTLTDKDLDPAMEKILDALLRELQAVRR